MKIQLAELTLNRGILPTAILEKERSGGGTIIKGTHFAKLLGRGELVLRIFPVAGGAGVVDINGGHFKTGVVGVFSDVYGDERSFQDGILE